MTDLPDALADLEAACRAAWAQWCRCERAKITTAKALGWDAEKMQAAGVFVEVELVPREAERDRSKAGKTRRGERAKELAWRVAQVWGTYLAAWRRHAEQVEGWNPPREPVLTGRLRQAVEDALLRHDQTLLGAAERQEWRDKSFVRAAVIGLFLSPWHTGTDANNNVREGGKRWLSIEYAVRPMRGKTDPVPEMATLCFAARERRRR